MTTYNLQPRKTPIYHNINDLPVAPTSQAAGNGADLLSRVNGLVDDVEAALNSLETGKLDASEAENFFVVDQTRSVATGFYTPLITLQTANAVSGQLTLNCALSNSFQVVLNELAPAQIVTANQMDGQIITLLFWHLSSQDSWDLSTNSFWEPTIPATTSNQRQVISYLVASNKLFELARGPVFSAGGGY